ncbi:MAG: VWA domain-containing protein [Pseudomonadota bacterium]
MITNDTTAVSRNGMRTERAAAAHAAWSDAIVAAALLAVAPGMLGGIIVHAGAGPVRESWLETLRELCGDRTPLIRFPALPSRVALAGGLDLTESMIAGRSVFSKGLLARGGNALAIVPMAERLARDAAADMAAALDAGVTGQAAPVSFILLDESDDGDEETPRVLAERVAFAIDLRATGWQDRGMILYTPRMIEKARVLLPSVVASSDIVRGLVGVAASLGIGSERPAHFALHAARCAAALDGRSSVNEQDVVIAGRLIFAGRARHLPPPQPDAHTSDETEQNTPDDLADAPPEIDRSAPDEAGSPPEDHSSHGAILADVVIDAVRPILPPDLLPEGLAQARSGSGASHGKSGAKKADGLRGRPLRSRPGKPDVAGQVDVVATLSAAAPWQVWRRRMRGDMPGDNQRLVVLPQDIRLKRFKQASESALVFVVDASGSAALNRLGEAKGAVELMLADAYARRDQVALIVFRDRNAQLLLPPTRSLTRAKRLLGALPAGGGTPLAHGLETAHDVVRGVTRRGVSAALVLLSDGGPNVTRDGVAGRREAEQDAERAARCLADDLAASIVIDTAPRPAKFLRALADTLRGTYVALPFANAQQMSRVASQVAAAAREA